MPPITAITAGSYHACAITSGGGLMCWGANYSGQLGDGSTTDRLAAVPVVGLASGVAALAAGEGHTCAVMSTGAVKCWGSNEAGQLGDGSMTQSLTPVDVVGLPTGVRAIAAGWGGHTCAITAEGGVKCWGNNGAGQLGDGTMTSSLTPSSVGLLQWYRAIVAGGFQTCALTSAGGVKCWGTVVTYRQRLPVPDTVPVDVVGLFSGVTSIAAGDGYTCAITASGRVLRWARTRAACSGKTPRRTASSRSRSRTSSTGSARSPPGSPTSAAPRAAAGSMLGLEHVGQLGDGTTVDSPSPVAVSGLTSGVTAIAVNGFSNYACAISRGGRVKCWGSNKGGQLGNGTTTSSSVPVDVSFARRQAASPTAGVSWAATIAVAGLSGRAALAVPPTGWATSAFSLGHLKTVSPSRHGSSPEPPVTRPPQRSS